MTHEERCKRRRRRWLTFDRLIIGATLMGLFGQTTIGNVEGSMFPPVRNFVITDVADDGQGGIYISGTLEVLRPACSLVGIDWNVFDDLSSAPIQISFIEPTRPRPVGEQRFGPWRLNIAATELESSTAIVLYDCPLGFWLTRTRLYPTYEG